MQIKLIASVAVLMGCPMFCTSWIVSVAQLKGL
jgi:hypothetical protein